MDDLISKQAAIDALDCINGAEEVLRSLPPAQPDGNGMTDLYVRDRQTGKIHRIGDDHHDQLTYNERGQICYHNLQNGDGCRTGDDGLRAGYEFVMNEDDHGYNMDPREQEDGGLT